MCRQEPREVTKISHNAYLDRAPVGGLAVLLSAASAVAIREETSKLAFRVMRTCVTWGQEPTLAALPRQC